MRTDRPGQGGRSEQTESSSRGNHDRHNQENVAEFLHLLLEAAKRIWAQIKAAANFVMVDMGGYQTLDRAVQWSVQHPQMSLFLLALGLGSLLPVLLIAGVVLSTVAMTFTGILVMEGTLLTILSMMLFGLLGALLIVLVFFTVLAVAAYLGFAQIYDLYGNVETYKLALTRFLQKENQNPQRESSVGNVSQT
ncbi:uncharacterized protein LOC106096047 [Stomoxys calcitrans]|uniref:uncharacterized protein LOC106096047 n=1 Tax=Stomoxys calcitrans TaxID=35570 RepID=UPI0027E33F46|nr:uncharacterized protein LOC106096047 [Stomoxys calcitrans]